MGRPQDAGVRAAPDGGDGVIFSPDEIQTEINVFRKENFYKTALHTRLALSGAARRSPRKGQSVYPSRLMTRQTSRILPGMSAPPAALPTPVTQEVSV